MTAGNRANEASPSGALTLSAVVPVRNGGSDLDRCLSALVRSSPPPDEILVVDDGSTDDSAAVARRHGATVIRLKESHGPAFARNRGAEAATGDILFFTDADVCVQEDTLRVAAATLSNDTDVCAVIGSYDDAPGHPSFLSQYKNMFHHWVHQTSSEEAWTFWTGCGAVRRRAFLDIGGFNEGYPKPSIEDIELGFRLRIAGQRLRLKKTMLAKHMKRWRFWNLMFTDVFRRGVPWIALMMRDKFAAKDLNLSSESRLGTIFSYLFVLACVVLPFFGHEFAPLPALAFILTASLCSGLSEKGGRVTWRSALAILITVTSPLLLFVWRPDPVALFPLALLFAIVWMHRPFYVFFRQRRGVGFALAAVPMHVLFFLCCGVCVPFGMIVHAFDRRRARVSATGPGVRNLKPLAVSQAGRIAGDAGS